MRISRDCWQCEYPDCGHVWIASSEVPPEQCARCRKRKWHTLAGEESKSTQNCGKRKKVSRPVPAKRVMQTSGKNRKQDGGVVEQPERRVVDQAVDRATTVSPVEKMVLATQAVSAIGEKVKPAAELPSSEPGSCPRCGQHMVSWSPTLNRCMKCSQNFQK